MCCVSSRREPITVKVSVFPRKKSLSEVKEIKLASPFYWMLIYFKDRGGRAMYSREGFSGFVGESGYTNVVIDGKSRVSPVDQVGCQ
jgi:hypothetical protein